MPNPPAVSYFGDGSTTIFEVPFPFLRPDHIVVESGGAEVPYIWEDGNRVRIRPAPSSGVMVRILRRTPTTPLYTIPDNQPVPAHWFNQLTQQALYVAEENQKEDLDEDLREIAALLATLTNPVRFIPQALTTPQQDQARTNIGAAGARPVVTEAEAAAGSGTDVRDWTPQRVKGAADQAISLASPVRFTAQTLTGAQQAQARTNIGASPVIPSATTAEAEAGTGTLVREWSPAVLRQAVAKPLADTGLGVSSAPVTADIDATSFPSGFRRVDSSTSGTFPDSASKVGTLQILRRSPDQFEQVYSRSGDGRVFRRWNTSGSWSAWAEAVQSSDPRLSDGASFASRALAQAATVSSSVGFLSVLHSGIVLPYIRDASGTALVLADGSTWSPAGDARPEHFGAVGRGIGNDSPAVTAWLNFVLAGRQRKGVASQRYRLASRVVVGFPTDSGMPVQRPALDCAGAVFVIPPENTTGGIRIEKHNNMQHLDIRNLEIHSAIPIGTHGSATNGTGLHLHSTLRPGNPGWGVTAQSELLLDNVKVTCTVNRVGPGSGRWDNGIVVDGFWWPRLVGCEVHTNHPGTRTTQDFESGHGFFIVNCYSPFLINCQSLGRWNRNFNITENTGMKYEDFQVISCYGTGGRYGLVVEVSPELQEVARKEPGGAVIGGHYNGQDKAIMIRHRRQFTVSGVLLYSALYTTDATFPEASGLHLAYCMDAQVNAIQAPEGGHYTSNADCMAALRLTGRCHSINITGLQAGMRGVGVHASGLTSDSGNIRLNGALWGNSFGLTPTVNVLDPSGHITVT